MYKVILVTIVQVIYWFAVALDHCLVASMKAVKESNMVMAEWLSLHGCCCVIIWNAVVECSTFELDSSRGCCTV